jgi:hypothetical protein
MGCIFSAPSPEAEVKQPEPKKSMTIPMQHLSIDDESTVGNPMAEGEDLPQPRERAPTLEERSPHIVIEDFKDQFEVGREMGQGAFSIVYEGKQISTGETYALKVQ